MRRPDFERIYSGLKDFQHDTVEYVFKRMYLDEPPARRFLVADEVGLGKTLVARGVIARAIEHLWDDIDRIDVVYICSNADIARQNISRLNITQQRERAFAQRLTLMALEMKDLTQNKINFVSFTPGTSFDLKDTMGWARERAVLFWLVRRVWGDDAVKPGRKGDRRVFQGWAGPRSLDYELRKARPQVEALDPGLLRSFKRALRDHERACRAERRPTLRARFEDLRCRFAYDLKKRLEPDWRDRTEFIGELRTVLARSIVGALEPDLVILDEFQRFKHLLDADTEAARLARELFNFEGTDAKARVLLLSATPYKMYTLAEESDQDDHYADFLRTTGFLLEESDGAFERELKAYRTALMGLTADPDSHRRVTEAKTKVEARLRRVMVRTERLAIHTDRSGMLVEKARADSAPLPDDLLGYVAFDRFASCLGASGDVEYWKSIPCFPNFMDGYQLGREFEKAKDRPEQLAEAQVALAGTGIIDWNRLRSFKAVDAGSAHLRALETQLLDAGAWRLLWLAPALPYYQPGKPFNSPGAAALTKRLVFSAWNGVPRSLASLLSYGAERRMAANAPASYQNTPEARARQTELLKLTESKGRLTGMPVLAMMYPSPALARLGDPLRIAAELGAGDCLPPFGDVLRRVMDAIEGVLREFPADEDGREDESWYWAAPLLLDERLGQAGWINREEVVEAWTPAGARAVQGLERHVAEARAFLDGHTVGGKPLGRRPADLIEVLAWLAVGGPANCALRALQRTAVDIAATDEMRDAAARVGGEFRSLFNLPEVRFVVRPAVRGSRPYWQKVLRYCVNGNLQAVLDEYVHVLRGFIGILDAGAEGGMRDLGKELAGAVSLRSAIYVARDPAKPWDEGRESMRSRFALQFGQRQTETEGVLQRSEDVRTAFNSPFWPFVLASTSVGQEGLDFHLYCHAIVHWNLPANPVDLEQREGRIHRFKGHAVRKNLAEHHRRVAFEGPLGDPWEKMFRAAAASRRADENDLVPYWVLSGTAAIERHVPMMPLSREVSRLANLKRTLAVYRLVFGQPRQEDLVEFLLSRGLAEEQIGELVDELRVDLKPPAVGGSHG
jgi:hypothetical protein